MIYALGERRPEIHSDTFVAPSAELIGSVILHEKASVWFNVTIRADNDVIEIGEGSNIQDGSVLHVDDDVPLHIGRHVTVGHKVMLHGCTIGDGTLIGMNAVVLNHANIGKGCLIGANALVTENMQVPDGSMVLGSPGKIVRQLDADTQRKLLAGADHYAQKVAIYREGLKPLA
ncbi:gamma carbonic anhydrase family protein [Granulosicoccaceae sp. 1_MG-2023]|nr:gamma carbonic anhydrase family protein [Granulosicoccaceae sp. 1_MG-2023]